LNPENIGYKFQLGKTLIEGNINIEEGLVLLDETNNLTPDNHLFLYWKAKAHYNLGNYKEAMFQVEKAIDINQMYFHDAIMLKKEIEQAVAN
jgi:tetratricopeptide (TPR) repeat protein